MLKNIFDFDLFVNHITEITLKKYPVFLIPIYQLFKIDSVRKIALSKYVS